MEKLDVNFLFSVTLSKNNFCQLQGCLFISLMKKANVSGQDFSLSMYFFTGISTNKKRLQINIFCQKFYINIATGIFFRKKQVAGRGDMYHFDEFSIIFVHCVR